MSDHDKMMAFGRWVSSRKVQVSAELFALTTNHKASVDYIRVKAGHLEALQHVLDAFTDLYNGDTSKFLQQYLGETAKEEDEEKEKTDG